MTNVLFEGIGSLYSIPSKQIISSYDIKVISNKRRRQTFHFSNNSIKNRLNNHPICILLIVSLLNQLFVSRTVSAFPAFSNCHFSSTTRNNIIMTPTTSTAATSSAAVTSSSVQQTEKEEVTTGFDINTLPIDTLAATANAYASANGVQVETVVDGTTSSYFQTAPISLLPNAYPNDEFQKATSVAPLFNLLVDRVSHDANFLQETLGGSVSDADPYTGKLLKLYNEIYVSSSTTTTIDDETLLSTTFAKQADALGIFRSDYMLSRSSNADGDDTYHIKQVELNTIASSFAGLSSKVAQLHTYLVERYSPESTPLQLFLQANQQIVTGSTNTHPENGVPTNPTLDKLPEAFHVAIERYKGRFVTGDTDNDIIVLFVVQPNERNTVDQRMLEFALYDKYKIRIVRKSLADIHTSVSLNSETGAITIADTNQEIAIVYYRAGYAPTDYPSGINGIEWLARKKLELSRATKCPNLGYHLAGTKKVQQALARPGAIEKYFTSKDDTTTDHDVVSKLRATFAGLYSLDVADITESDYKVIDQILNTDKGRELFVLKPQREGGGYNFYGTNLYNKLRENVQNNTDSSNNQFVLSKELGEYILMERLFPPQQPGILLRGGKMEGRGDTISELGCFGCIVSAGDGTSVYHNEYAGFLLRTKFSNVDEGGVASGFATLSSPYLC